MKRFVLAAALYFLVCASAISGNDGRFVPVYGTVKNPSLQEFASRLREQNIAEDYANLLSQAIVLPYDIALAFGECGHINAFYSSQKRALVICLELIINIADTIRSNQAANADPDKWGKIFGGALAFVLLHELGHALIHLYKIPVLGREEDAADQISMALLLKTPEAPYAVAGASWFFSKQPSSYSKAHLADSHSLNPQRRYNVYCWAFGSNPTSFGVLVKSGALPPNRAPRCGAEYEQLNRSVKQLIGPYVKFEL